MSDHTSSREHATTGTMEGERPPDAPLPHTAFVNQWRSGDTLLTLRELLDLAEEVGPTIARRAELGHTELKAIELLVRSPHGPVELARELGVTSAASSGIVDRLEARGHVRREAHATDGRLPWSRARSLLIRLCQIVHGLHAEGIILGGLEARHCYAIRGKNKHEAIKVVNNAVIEQLASTIGPHAGHGATVLARYIAPEQACGEPIDARSDVYSFGVIAYELLSGSVPFTDANPVRLVSMHLQCRPRPPREVAPDAEIPAEVEAVLLRSLAKDPADRFPTMDAFAAALIAVPESSLPAGAHTVVSASTAASEIPTAPVDAAPTAAQAPASPTPAATPVAAPATPAPVAADATPATPPVADATTATPPVAVAATATPPVTDAPAPATTPVAVAATNAPAPATLPVTDAAPATPPVADAPAPAAPPVTTVSDPAPSAPNVPTPARRAASIPTHVTLPPGSLSSDMIRGAATTTTVPAVPSNGHSVAEQVLAINAGMPDALVVNNGSLAENRPVVACTEAAMEANASTQLITLTNLASVAPNIVLGGSAEFLADDSAGYPAMQRYYGGEFKNTVTVDDADLAAAIADGDADCFGMNSLNPLITTEKMTIIEDDQLMAPSNAVVALIASTSATPDVMNTLDAVLARLTTKRLNQMLNEIVVNGTDPFVVANAFVDTL